MTHEEFTGETFNDFDPSGIRISKSSEFYIVNSTVHRVSKKTVQNSFSQNFVKFPPILIIFGRKTAKIMRGVLIFHLT